MPAGIIDINKIILTTKTPRKEPVNQYYVNIILYSGGVYSCESDSILSVCYRQTVMRCTVQFTKTLQLPQQVCVLYIKWPSIVADVRSVHC